MGRGCMGAIEALSTHITIRMSTGHQKISGNVRFYAIMQLNMSQPPVVLDSDQRVVVERAIKEVCQIKNFLLHAVNVRKNHVHAVVSAQKNLKLSLTFLRNIPRENLETQVR
jgi:REP element-mobilizing transposase RayT